MDIFMEEGHTSLIKYGEELCGDCVESTYHDDKMTLVLADGLGSGVKANILSTLTAKIICTMMAEGLNMEECVSTIASTLPVCAERQIAYSTFTILQVGRDGNAYLAQFDNPETIFIRDGKVTPYEKTEKNLHGKLIYESRFTLQEDDMFLAMSDGVIHAGVGMLLNFGWQMEDVVNYVQENYRKDMSAKMMANTLVGACRDLYMDKAGDDTTVAVMRIRQCQIVNIMLGPPVDPKDDDKVVEEFLGQPGKKIVSGGTTSKMVAKHLGTEVTTDINYIDPEVPPIGYIKGIDLVTEGVLTIGKVLELSGEYLSETDFDPRLLKRRDGASLIARLLFEEATHVNFFVGRAMNPAYQNPDLPINLSIKFQLVRDLAKNLERMGKIVTVKYS